VLALQCRLELSRREFDKAIRTLQTGFTLARHLGEAPILMHQLVGIAISANMLARVEEIIQTPGSPNLYWALTALPNSLIDVRKSTRYEMDTIHRSFPILREMETTKLQPQDMEKRLDEMIEKLALCEGGQLPLWRDKLAFAAIAAKEYPKAKEYLLARGRTAEQIDVLPVTQAVLLFYIGDYNQLRNEMDKWMSLPHWQAKAGINQLEKRVKDSIKANESNVLITLIFPAIMKTYEAQVRVDRQFAALRCVEAIRLSVETNGGNMPASLSDVRAAPLPVDPFTGKGFDAMYKREGDKAIFDVPAIQTQPLYTARRYELTSIR